MTTRSHGMQPVNLGQMALKGLLDRLLSKLESVSPAEPDGPLGFVEAVDDLNVVCLIQHHFSIGVEEKGRNEHLLAGKHLPDVPQ